MVQIVLVFCGCGAGKGAVRKCDVRLWSALRGSLLHFFSFVSCQYCGRQWERRSSNRWLSAEVVGGLQHFFSLVAGQYGGRKCERGPSNWSLAGLERFFRLVAGNYVGGQYDSGSSNGSLEVREVGGLSQCLSLVAGQ